MLRAAADHDALKSEPVDNPLMRVCLPISLAVLLTLVLPSFASAGPNSVEDGPALDAATHAMCDRQIVLLGESATHGDGHTEAFKVALVERLVDRCGFDSVFFEANQAEFLHFNQLLRAGQPVSGDDIAAAVGGLWRFDLEFQPLLPFLLARARAGTLTLGGIDDQSGQMGQHYANEDELRDLTGLLPLGRRAECETALHRRVYSDYAEAAPYSATDRALIETCLEEIGHTAAADRTLDHKTYEDRLQMISALERWIGRDFSPGPELMVQRDRSMFQNFEWLRLRQPRRRKAIVWAATVHIAKKGDPTWADRTGTNFGTFVHQEYGDRAFALGFSAVGGSYRQLSHDTRPMPAAPPDSLEATALRDLGGASYLGETQLRAAGRSPGAFFQHAYQTLTWADFLDGVVLFREERATERSDGR